MGEWKSTLGFFRLSYLSPNIDGNGFKGKPKGEPWMLSGGPQEAHPFFLRDT